MAICCRNYWDSVTEFNDNIVQELKFWYFHAESIKFRCVTPFYRKFERIIFSDASEYAGVGIIEIILPHSVIPLLNYYKLMANFLPLKLI
jgi:hypothetical protein